MRKDLARFFVENYKLKQKEAAKILGVTEAAVSQYVKSKRANDVRFTKKELAEIKKTAKIILEDRSMLMEGIYKLCIAFRGSKTVCDFHRNKDGAISKDCEICMSG